MVEGSAEGPCSITLKGMIPTSTIRCRMLCSIVVVALIRSALLAQPAHPVTFRTNGYTGHLLLAGTELNTGGGTLDLLLPEGENFIETGDARCSPDGEYCSYLRVMMNPDGRMTGCLPSDAATIADDGLSLDLRTFTIQIRPGGYQGQYFPSWVIPSHTPWRHQQTAVLVSGLTYNMSNGTGLSPVFEAPPFTLATKDNFRFKVGGAGVVSIPDNFLLCATGGNRRVTFRTALVKVGQEMLGSTSALRLSSDPQVVISAPGYRLMMHGLLSWWKNGDMVQEAYFIP